AGGSVRAITRRTITLGSHAPCRVRHACCARERPRMSPSLLLAPLAHAQGTVKLPGSKSISNRVLLLAALAAGTTTLTGLLESDDTPVMLAALRMLGIEWRKRGGET